MNRDTTDAVRENAPVLVGVVVTVVAFLFGVKLLGSATEAAAPAVGAAYDRVVVGDASALGTGWLGAYVLTNGSVVAAVSLSLFDAGVLGPAHLLLMVAGSRLGAAAVVLLVGALDFFGTDYSLTEATEMGVLAFLLTHSVFLPVTALAYLGLPWATPGLENLATGFRLRSDPLGAFDPAVEAVVDVGGPLPTLGLAVVLLFASLRGFDRALSGIDAGTVRDHLFRHFSRKWVSFGVGVLVTGLTTSVAFSLGMVVPLYNRGYVDREEVLPYVLGANVGTFADTVVVALALDAPVGVAVVLFVVGLSVVVTLLALLAYGPYAAGIGWTHRRITTDRRAYVGFLLALVAVPLSLVVVPLVAAALA